MQFGTAVTNPVQKERMENTMRKMLTMVLALLLALSMSSAYAEDLGIQVIGGPNAATQTQSLDDIQVGTTYTLDGFAKVTPVEYLVVDYFAQFNKDADYTKIYSGTQDSEVYYEPKREYNAAMSYKDASWQDSGMNAEFVWLKLDIINLQKEPISFMKNIEVKVVYDGEYEFAGWVRQINYDYNIICYRAHSDTKGGATIVMNPANEEAINPMYTGTYVIGCTLPNSVFEDKAPLNIEIDIAGNQLTYQIKK